MLVEAKIKAASSFVEGDAPIAGKAHATTEAASSSYDPPASHRQRRGTKRRAAVALATPPTEAPTGDGGWASDDWSGHAARQDFSEHDGQRYTKNRGGYRICPWFQAGNCPMGTGPGNACLYDSSCVHQCDRCLRTGHGSGRGCPKGKGAGKPAGGGGKPSGGGKGGWGQQKAGNGGKSGKGGKAHKGGKKGW